MQALLLYLKANTLSWYIASICAEDLLLTLILFNTVS